MTAVTLWALLSALPFAVIAAVAIGFGFGPAIAALLANSRIARGAAIAAAVTWGLFVAATRIRAAGRHEGQAEVEAANEAARDDRARIEAEVGKLSDAQVDRELQEYAR